MCSGACVWAWEALVQSQVFSALDCPQRAKTLSVSELRSVVPLAAESKGSGEKARLRNWEGELESTRP